MLQYFIFLQFWGFKSVTETNLHNEHFKLCHQITFHSCWCRIFFFFFKLTRKAALFLCGIRKINSSRRRLKVSYHRLLMADVSSSWLRKKPKEEKNHREATESNNICSNIFDHCSYCAEMGHGCHRHIKHLVVVWVSGISDEPLFTALSTPSALRSFKRRHCFSAEELKSFFSLFHFSAHLWWLIASHFSRPESLVPFSHRRLLFRWNKRLFPIEYLSAAPPTLAM